MALPKQTQKILNKRLSLMDDEVDDFRVEKIEQQVFKQLSRFLIKELDLDKEGNVKRTAKNLRTIQKSKLTIRNILLSDEYKRAVSKYVGTFDEVKTLSDKYIEQL